jgi:hypothetical protein
MGIHEDTSNKGEEEIRNSIDIGSFSNEEGCCLIKIKNKKWITKNICRNNKEGKVEN